MVHALSFGVMTSGLLCVPKVLDNPQKLAARPESGSLQNMTQPWQQDPYQRRPVDISAYAPPKRPGGMGWFIALGVALVAVVIGLLTIRPQLPEPAATPAPQPTATSTGPGMPFAAPGFGGGEGRWEILQHTWAGDEVTLRVRITADKGNISYGFLAFFNTDMNGGSYEPVPGAPSPSLDTGILSSGQTAEGYIRFDLPRGPGTLILTTAGGRQMSALPIPT